MTAEAIVEIYRTQENREKHTFVSAVTITYFNNIAYVQGLSGTFTITCWKELYQYFKSIGIRQAQYFRRGKLKSVDII